MHYTAKNLTVCILKMCDLHFGNHHVIKNAFNAVVLLEHQWFPSVQPMKFKSNHRAPGRTAPNQNDQH